MAFLEIRSSSLVYYYCSPQSAHTEIPIYRNGRIADKVLKEALSDRKDKGYLEKYTKDSFG